MFLHTYCTCRARIQGNCRVGWTLVGQGRGGIGKHGKKLFFTSLFSCDSDFFHEVVFAFRFRSKFSWPSAAR
jgi:hypothetical protein